MVYGLLSASFGPVQVVAAVLFLGMILGLLWLLPGGWRIARAIATLLVLFLRLAWKAICVACRLLAAAAKGLKRLFGRIFEAAVWAASARRSAHRRKREIRAKERGRKKIAECEEKNISKSVSEGFSLSA